MVTDPHVILPPREILRVVLSLEGSSGISRCDAFEGEGRIWLVPEWLEFQDGSARYPERLVPLDQFDHQKHPGDDAEYLITQPIPRAVFYSKSPEKEANGYEVHLNPLVNRMPGEAEN